VTHVENARPGETLDTALNGVVERGSSRPDSRLRFDQRILLLALVAGLPAALVALILLWTGPYTSKV
jgi:hypothetical protein